MSAIFIDCAPEVAAVFGDRLRAVVPDLAVHEGQPAGEALPALLAGHRAALVYGTALPHSLLAGLGDLKVIVYLSTGAASYIDVDAAASLGIRVRNVTGYGNRTIAEHAFALILAAARDLAAMDREVRGGAWQPRPGLELAGKTLGIVGLGGTGKALAGIAAAFGMRVIAWSRGGVPAGLDCEAAALDDLMATADVVSLHLALTPETRGLIDRRRLALMRREAILVNTARGALIDEAALVEALETGRLGHAALDVFATEPLAAGHPLCRLANVTLSAHAAYNTPEATSRLLETGLEMLRDELAALAD